MFSVLNTVNIRILIYLFLCVFSAKSSPQVSQASMIAFGIAFPLLVGHVSISLFIRRNNLAKLTVSCEKILYFDVYHLRGVV